MLYVLSSLAVVAAVVVGGALALFGTGRRSRRSPRSPW